MAAAAWMFFPVFRVIYTFFCSLQFFLQYTSSSSTFIKTSRKRPRKSVLSIEHLTESSPDDCVNKINSKKFKEPYQLFEDFAFLIAKGRHQFVLEVID